jgi:D-alanyl-D-alanine carboxypeptidase/D-alanyl-D-alanine-endopeptidase (penicillin-binding protein 4)
MLLEVLGPDYQYETPLYGIGQREGEAWKGDLLFVGKGDPAISGTYFDEQRWHVFEKFYKVLDSLGIKRVTGSVMGNDGYFVPKPYPEGWEWNDLSYYYAVEINALSFNENTVELDVHANGEVGDTPHISWFPFNTNYVRFINEQVITPPHTEFDESYRRILGTNNIILKSKLPQNYFEEEPLSVAEPSGYFVDTFVKYLNKKGISVKGGTVVDHEPVGKDTSSYRLFATHLSPGLDTLLYQINRESSNFYTEMLLRTAAAEHFNTQGSTRLGLKLIGKFADKMKVDTTRLNLSDGSGMAGNTFTTTEDLSAYLVEMRDHENYPAFYKSLSVADQNGTFKTRFGDSPISGDLRGKSGFISGVRTLSGYLTTSSGQELIVSMAANNYTVKKEVVDKAQKKILEYLYRKY